MDVMTAVLTRRSRQTLNEPAPGDAEFAYLLGGAAAAPDHGSLRPWRWILLRGEDRKTLGESLASEAPPEQRDRIAGKALRAPLMAALVFRPVAGHKVPEWADGRGQLRGLRTDAASALAGIRQHLAYRPDVRERCRPRTAGSGTDGAASGVLGHRDRRRGGTAGTPTDR